MAFKKLLLAAALAGSVGLTFAADPVVLVPTGPGMFSGEFWQGVDGLFVDTFSFLPESFAGHVSVVLSSLSGPVSFFTASLNGQDFSFFPGPMPMDFAFQADVTSDMPLTLTVFGAVLDANGNPGGMGAYHGAIMAAVPEPQTWALLIAGLAGVGFMARRRGQAVVV